MKKENCSGCYNNIYNCGAGGARECFYFKDAKLVWKKEVHINQCPPFNQKTKRFPSCYRKPQYCYIDANIKN